MYIITSPLMFLYANYRILANNINYICALKVSLVVPRVESDPVALRLILRGLVRVEERFVDLALGRVVLHALLLFLLLARIHCSAVGGRFRLFGCGHSVGSFFTVL